MSFMAKNNEDFYQIYRPKKRFIILQKKYYIAEKIKWLKKLKI